MIWKAIHFYACIGNELQGITFSKIIDQSNTQKKFSVETECPD